MESAGKEALIKGVFTPEQAKEVINTLFRAKIQMHTLSSFSSLIRTGKHSDMDNTRKVELSESLERLIKAINNMPDSELEVKINCLVKMEFVKQKPKKSKRVRG